MQSLTIPVTPLQQNCTLLWCSKTHETVVVDPGGDNEKIIAAISARKLKPVKILLTHGHFDHVGGAADLAQHYGIPIIGPHKQEAGLIAELPQQCILFGFPPLPAFTPTAWVEEGDSIQFGEETLEVVHCPGHTPGHVVFFNRHSQLALVGDVLFFGAIGRTDLPGGSYAQLISSIRQKLWSLGNEVAFIPGHGPNSTFGIERETNPYVRDRNFL